MNKRKKPDRRTALSAALFAMLLILAGCSPGRLSLPAQDTKSRQEITEDSGEALSGSSSAGVRTAGSGSGEDDGDVSVTSEGKTASGDDGSAEMKKISGNEENKAEKSEEAVQSKLNGMTLEEKAAQLFILTPEALTGMKTVTEAGSTTKNAFDRRPVGGLIYMKQNLLNSGQTRTMLSNVQSFSGDRLGLPVFTFVDEEGGSVRRISGNFSDVPEIPSMASLGASGDVGKVRQTGETMGDYLKDLGFTCDFAPVADVITNPANTVVKDRSFGTDPQTVSEMSLALGEGLESRGVLAVYKHFPGHGSTANDTHKGYASTERTLEELKASELVPFQNAVDNGASFIMVAHISLPNVTEEDVPASLSPEIITGLLREDMGYDGIVITDALSMEAIADSYGSGDAAVRAVLAGADMLLTPSDFESAYQAVLSAVRDGTLTEERIDESVTRILRVKLFIRQSEN